MLSTVMTEPRTTLPFDVFWEWLGRHYNCVVRAGTPETVLYDDDDLHWTFVEDEGGAVVAQLIRGKRLVAELFIEPEQVAYVQDTPSDNAEEHTFELVSETGSDRFTPFFFVLTHGLEVDEETSPRRVH